MENQREKVRSAINTSIAITIVSTSFFFGGLIYMGIARPFEYWYLLFLIVIPQIVLSIIYIIYIKKINIYNENPSKKILTITLTISLLFIITINIFAFLSIILCYKQLLSRSSVF